MFLYSATSSIPIMAHTLVTQKKKVLAYDDQDSHSSSGRTWLNFRASHTPTGRSESYQSS